MKMRADSVRAAYPLFQAEGHGSNPMSALELRIDEIPLQLARQLNRLWHRTLPTFETGFCNAAKVCYGAAYAGRWYAVAIWTSPVARLLPQRRWLELRRFAIAPDAPKNSASWLLAVMARIIGRQFPEIERLISYQAQRHHRGIIYKAAGWTPGSLRKGARGWSSRGSCNPSGTPRLRPDLNDATGPKVRWEKEIIR